MLRVFLLDDHRLMRTACRMILSKHGDIEIIGEAGTGEEALPLIRQLKPDVVICDLHLPGMSGLEVTERIVRAGQGAKVLMLSVQEDGPMPKRLLEAGASGYVGKACPEEELLRAVREVGRGRRFLGGELAQRMALSALDGGESPFDRLTPRELEVALMLCQGMRMADIGRRLSLSAKTVATHKYRLFDKLGIADAVSLARLAAQHGVTEPTQAL